MEATFQSYLTEAVYAMERERRQRLLEAEAEAEVEVADDDEDSIANSNQTFISYIDADSSNGDEITEEDEPVVNKPVVQVKMRDRSANNSNNRRKQCRPSAFNVLVDPPALQEPTNPATIASGGSPLFRRNTKFFMSVNKKRRSPPTFYLQRSQSTKEVGYPHYRRGRAGSVDQAGCEAEADDVSNDIDGGVTNTKSIFRSFGLKGAPTWTSVVAHLNRSFRGPLNSASTSSCDHHHNLRPPMASVWRRSQSCRNIEKLFGSRRYF
jgi:hypothetical protein